MKALSQYNDRSRVAAKQTNKQTPSRRNWQTFSYAEEQKVILTNRGTRRLTSGFTHRER